MRYIEPQAGGPADGIPLEAADAVARAAQLWVRSLDLTEPRDRHERRSLASGLLAGLCERLGLDPRTLGLVSYAYSLMDGDGNQALAVSRSMLRRPSLGAERQAFERGHGEAALIVEMLAYSGDKM